MVSGLAKFIGRAYHRVAHVIDYEKKSTVSRLRNDNTLVLLQKSLLKNEMSPSGRNNSGCEVGLVFQAELIGVHSSAIDDNVCLHLKGL